ncbi:MAG: DEAD/DEAH box helicase [Victivallaceae bacterium]|nr:DEAD/DEAH box helicase [Victivallaceae bacterium]
MISDLCDYKTFLNRKAHSSLDHGFEPIWMPDSLFDFQVALTNWAIRKGRAAIFADCGLGKTPMQLVWAENVLRQTNKPVLILTPLAVAAQTMKEGEKFGVDVAHRRTGIKQGDGVIVTNYERLHYFNSNDFGGVVCDESSILKNFDGQTKADVTDFMRKVPYRLLCTATAAPNDYIELGTSSEALGEMGFQDMLSMFFKKIDSTYSRKQEYQSGVYRFRGHSEHYFWRWVCSWARAMRKPSDLGFEDSGFSLPDLIIREHIVQAREKPSGMLFEIPAISLQEQRDELKRTAEERCEMAAELINNHDSPAVAWCHLNRESKMLKRMINGAVEVEGSNTDEYKEDAFHDFANGNIRVIVSKPTIAGFGLNWQHCAHMTFFPSHSYEQYYQAVRRCWRFGQKQNVTVDIISTEGQSRIFENLKRKSEAAEQMFDNLVLLMKDELKIERKDNYKKMEEIPSWL